MLKDLWLRDPFLTPCNKPHFLLSVFDVLTLGPCWPWKSAPPSISSFSEIANKSPRVHLSYANYPIQRAHPNHLHYPDLHSGPLFCSNPPWAIRPTTKDSPQTQVPAENIQTTHLSLLTLPHPVLPVEMTIKTPAYISSTPSASWLTLVLPQVALNGMSCLLFLGVCKDKKLFPSWQLFSYLCVLPYLI